MVLDISHNHPETEKNPKQTKLFLIIAPEMPHLINTLKSKWVDFLFRSHEGNT